MDEMEISRGQVYMFDHSYTYTHLGICLQICILVNVYIHIYVPVIYVIKMHKVLSEQICLPKLTFIYQNLTTEHLCIH